MYQLHFGSLLLTLLVGRIATGGDAAPRVSDAVRDEEGFLVHKVESPYQSGSTKIRVLAPKGKRPRVVVYILPVEAKDENRYGDGLTEIKRLMLHERFDAVFVSPTFDQLPWYADHPTDLAIRQESHFLKVVVPFVDRIYLEGKPEARHLLGFSKSGWGAFSLLLRNPGLFGKAVAWDAPFMMDRPGQYGSGRIFGTVENFETYRLSNLFRTNGGRLGVEPRLILLGHGNFKAEHETAKKLLEELKLPHGYVDGPVRKHVWESGWLTEAVEALAPPTIRR